MRRVHRTQPERFFTFYNDSNIQHHPHAINLGDPSGQNAVLSNTNVASVDKVAVVAGFVGDFYIAPRTMIALPKVGHVP